MKSKKAFLAVILVLVLGGFFYFGYDLGTHKSISGAQVAAAEGSAANLSGADYSPLWKVLQILQQKSIHYGDVTGQQKVWGAIEGLTNSLGDPYTKFFPPAENKAFESSIKGEFGGIGMEVGVQDGKLTVITPLPNTPAFHAGIKTGDTILSVDGSSTAQMGTDEAVSNIRGKIGTSVKITLLHKGAKSPVTLTVKRAQINIPTIDTKALPNGIYDIALYSFTSQSPDLFKSALRKYQMSGDHKLILDLRGNPGGYLEAAVDMASYFLPAGKVVVKEQSDGKVQNVYRSKGYNTFGNDKLVILVDGGTASAAEILSGALKQQGVATLVGQQTFGKGSVQQLIPITSDTSLKVTVAEWLTPNGTSISKNGLTPDIVVKDTDKELAAGTDAQLQKAIQILRTK
jgi:carboxyl-terminal processing protease